MRLFTAWIACNHVGARPGRCTLEQRRPELAYTIVERVKLELGAALALVKLESRR